MALGNSDSGSTYRDKLYVSATGLYRGMKYLVFVYVIGSALAVMALALTSGPGAANFSLASVLAAYGVAGLAAALFLYALVQVVILACCAYAEWLREDKHNNRHR